MRTMRFITQKPTHGLILQVAIAGCFSVTSSKDAKLTISGTMPPKTAANDFRTTILRTTCGFPSDVHHSKFRHLTLSKTVFDKPANNTCRLFSVSWSNVSDQYSTPQIHMDCQECKRVCTNAYFNGDSLTGSYFMVLPSARCEDTGKYVCRTIGASTNSSWSEDSKYLHMLPGRILKATDPPLRGNTATHTEGSTLTLNCSIFSTMMVSWDWWFKDFAYLADKWKRVDNISANNPPNPKRCSVAWASWTTLVISEWDYGRTFMCRAFFRTSSSFKFTVLQEQFYISKPGSTTLGRIFSAIFSLLAIELFMATLLFHMQFAAPLGGDNDEVNRRILLSTTGRAPAASGTSLSRQTSHLHAPPLEATTHLAAQHQQSRPQQIPSSDRSTQYDPTLEESSVDAAGADVSSGSWWIALDHHHPGSEALVAVMEEDSERADGGSRGVVRTPSQSVDVWSSAAGGSSGTGGGLPAATQAAATEIPPSDSVPPRDGAGVTAGTASQQADAEAAVTSVAAASDSADAETLSPPPRSPSP